MHGRTWRWGAGLGLLGLLALASMAGCGDTGDEATPARAAATTSTATPAAAPTSAAPTSAPASSTSATWEPASLPSCAGLANSTSPPRWLPTSLPEGLVLGASSSELYTGDTSQDPPPPPPRTEFTLAEATAQGELRSTFTIRRGGEQPDPWTYDTPEGAPVDGVRGLPGTIAKLISRGDGDGRIDAQWSEDGLEWTASADNTQSVPDEPSWTVEDMAAALAPLDLSAGTVADPSGRFVVVGQQPIEFTPRTQRTNLALSPNGDVDGAVEVNIEILPRGEGASGLSALLHVPITPGASLDRVGGRLVASNALVAIVELPDGSIATATANGGFDIVDGALRPAWTRPTQDELRELVLGLVAIDPGDPRLSEVPSPDPVNGFEWCSDAD